MYDYICSHVLGVYQCNSSPFDQIHLHLNFGVACFVVAVAASYYKFVDNRESNPRDLGYHYEWVTVDTYDDLQDAKIQYRIRLAEAKHEKEKEEQKKKSIEELKKKQEEENKIVEIIKMDD